MSILVVLIVIVAFCGGVMVGRNNPKIGDSIERLVERFRKNDE